MVIINNCISDDQIEHRKMKVLVRKQCLLWAKMFSDGFMVVVVARPIVIMEERFWSRWCCTKYQLGVHWATGICGDDNFQRAKAAYWSQAAEGFLSCHFAEIPTCSDQQWQPVACRGQFSVQNSTFTSCWSSFLSFEPLFWLPDSQSQSGSHSSTPPIYGSKVPAKSSLGA